MDLEHDLHVLDVIDACRTATAGGDTVPVESGFPELDLTLVLDPGGGATPRPHESAR